LKLGKGGGLFTTLGSTVDLLIRHDICKRDVENSGFFAV